MLESNYSPKYVMLESNIHNCNRCYHQWHGKLKNPKTCANPKCRSPYWNKPRIRTQNQTKSSNEKFYFYFERENSSNSYSFVIIDNKIICEECNNKTCNHVLDIMLEPKIREKIAKQGIEFSSKYENEIKELGKNTHALMEFYKNQIDTG